MSSIRTQRPKVESFEDYVYIAIHPLMHKKKWQIEPSELDLLLGRHYGMNFKFMAELEWRHGYFAAIAGMVLISLALYFYFNKKGYF
jgi:Mg2+ and Co2+ transporter CorA